MTFIQGFLVPVPKANKDAYAKQAKDAAPMFARYGALRIVESWADDIEDGKSTDFKKAVKAKDDEAVVFAFIEWPDRQTYEEAAKKMEADMEGQDMPEMPFDGKRMMWAGFEPIFEFKA